MGTTAHIVVDGGTEEMLQRSEGYLRRCEARWSRFLATSELSAVNRNAGSLTIVSPDTFALIDLAVQGWSLTAGAFDPTVGAALCALGYDRSFASIAVEPTQGRCEPLDDHPSPGCADIELMEMLHGVRVAPGTQIDVGGIAKGFAADHLVSELLAMGASGACVGIGGDVRVDGSSTDGSPWIVELVPVGATATPVRISLQAGAVCTSSSLGRRWRRGNTMAHHLIEPANGRPVENGLTKVTVVAATATQAEVLTKAAFVAGIDQGRELLERLGVAGLLTCDDETVIEVGNLEDLAA